MMSPTYASVRDDKSDIVEDMLDIASLLPDESKPEINKDAAFAVPGILTPRGSRKYSRGLEDIGQGLETPSLLKVEEWMNIDESGEYLGKRKHFLRIINTLNYDEKLMEVKYAFN